MSDAWTVGKKLVELCQQRRELEAINTLYSADIVSVEAGAPPGMPARYEGLEQVKGKAEWWFGSHDIHSAKAEGPWPHGDRFIVRFDYDVTAKSGPMAGQRYQISEAALYTVKDGKIAKEEFFYHMGS